MTAKELIDNAVKGAIVLEPQSTFNTALVGVSSDGRLVYSEDKILIALQEKDGMDYEEALEWYQYNTVRTLDYQKGRYAPIILTHTL
jgi:hypothetical protein